MTKSWFDLIPTSEMIKWRRYLHQNPELSFHEEKTSHYLIHQLKSFGDIKIEQPTPTSVLGTITGKSAGKKILLRADIDALPVQEETKLEFSSQTPSVMHACGHDTHMAILLATAKVLVQLRNQFSGSVQVLFQHAEETPPGGAQEIVQSGYLKNIDAIIGLHIIPFLPTGSINVVLGGPFSTASDVMKLTIQGKGGHGSMPQNSIDPIIVGNEIINQIQTVVSRLTAPDELNVVNIGEFKAGSAPNVIADTAYLSASIRSVNQTTRQIIAQKIKAIVQNTCQTYGATPKLDYQFYYDAVINDSSLSKLVYQSAQQVLGPQLVTTAGKTSASEDFSAYGKLAPLCYFILGGGLAAEGYKYANHSPQFIIDEKALINGVKTDIATVLNFLQ